MRFLVQVCLGILRHQEYRRNFLASLIISALLLLFLGSTWLSGWLSARPFLFILFWFACVWFTATSFLLAAYDMLVVRKAARAEEKRLRQEVLAQHQQN